MLHELLLFQSHVPLIYWSDCIYTVVFLINRTPSLLLGNKIPYELLIRKSPDHSFLKSFGCLCYASTLPKDRNKFSAMPDACVFLGYPSCYKGYKVLHLDSNRITITRNIVFHEHDFPFKNDAHTNERSSDFFAKTTMPFPIPVSIVTIHPDMHLDTHNSHDIPIVSETVPPNTGQGNLFSGTVKTPGYLSQYYCSLAQSSLLPKTFDSTFIPTLSSSTPYPLSSVLTYSHLKPLYQSYILSYSLETEPTSFKQAMLSPEFKQATIEELQAMEANHTWTVESLPPGKNVVGCKWVYTIKYRADGTSTGSILLWAPGPIFFAFF